ncbi:substrate-binding domain-containing protein [Jatrophihabitans telluris]|uniref:Substrate-binding domain-containing protein n=1 Tax=Jatrophihabitans telluris TaxID=2038343 RepID=A0ABY4QWD7_9ACTN|nr:substrate-binding domain-containing protein [Jatrophihabitans telluris]
MLNRPERVSASTRERVLRAMDELGFSRDSSAAATGAGSAPPPEELASSPREPDRRSAGIVAVAKRARVSVGTVSNVLNRPDKVTPKTRDRVLRAIEELGFVRNEAARQLRIGRSRTVGLIVLDVANPFFVDIAGGAEKTAEKSGLSLVICNSSELPDREAHYLSLLEEQRSFGILLTPVMTKNPRIEEIRKRGTPVVLVDRASGRGQCSVSVDDVSGGQSAVNHLIGQGHERIAFVGGPRSIKQVQDRLKGSRLALDEAGMPTSSLVTFDTDALTVAEGRRAGAWLSGLSRADRPTAAFCANDLLALGLLQEMTSQGRSVPQDLAIIGYDDIDFASAAAVPLSSVRQPRQLLGQTATELLIDEAAGDPAHKHRQVVFQPELVVRDSTRLRRAHPKRG